MKAVIIDDELNARVVLENYLEEYCSEVSLAGMADGVEEGLKLIQETNPDIVFLDIEMNDGTGFNLLEQLETINFKVIFTTAYNEYALEAFKFSALHYILKPIDPDDLIEAVKRAEVLSVKASEITKPLQKSLDGEKISHITLRTEKAYHVIPFDEIVFLEADGNYTKFCIDGGKVVTASKTMREYESLLKDKGFYRIHKSYLVNLNAVSSVISGSNEVVMKCGKKLTVSRRNKADFIKQL